MKCALRLSRLGCALVLVAGAADADVDIATDLVTARQGADVFINTCSFCHSLKYVRFRDLATLGYSAEELDAIRLARPIEATMSSSLPREAAMAMFGQEPPDLSLIAKAHEGGAGYVYDLLSGYHLDAEGRLKNRVFPGIKMQDVLGAASAKDPKAEEAVKHKAYEVASFLLWAADPQAQRRRTIGYYVIGYLILLTALLYALKRRVWRRLPPAESA